MKVNDFDGISDYESQARESLAKSRDCLAAGKLHQASDKGWGAAVYMAKAVAAAQGWRYDKNNDVGYNEVLRRARELSANRRIGELRAVASDLHGNHYIRKRYLIADSIGASLENVAELLELLAPLAAPKSGGSPRPPASGV